MKIAMRSRALRGPAQLNERAPPCRFKGAWARIEPNSQRVFHGGPSGFDLGQKIAKSEANRSLMPAPNRGA